MPIITTMIDWLHMQHVSIYVVENILIMISFVVKKYNFYKNYGDEIMMISSF